VRKDSCDKNAVRQCLKGWRLRCAAGLRQCVKYAPADFVDRARAAHITVFRSDRIDARRPARVVIDQDSGLRVIDLERLRTTSSRSSSRWTNGSPVASSLPATFGGLNLM